MPLQGRDQISSWHEKGLIKPLCTRKVLMRSSACLYRGDELRCRRVQKSAIPKKIRRENHLSSSRRRALRSFFVQSQVVVQTMPPPRPAAGSVGCLVIARCARFCEEVQRPCTVVCSSGELGGEGRRPVYKVGSCEKLRKVGFSFLVSFAPGAHESPASLLSKQL